MTLFRRLRRLREWFPVPTSQGRLHLVRWVLLEGHRLAVSAALLGFVFATLVLSGVVWPFEMRQILTETSTVQDLLLAFLSGIILLVSIVVSINSIVLSQDMTSAEHQERRIRGVVDFRREIGEVTGNEESPSVPAAFLREMSDVIDERARELADAAEHVGEDDAAEVQSYVDSVTDIVEELETVEDRPGPEFGALWVALEFDYGHHLDRSRALGSSLAGPSEPVGERLDDLLEAFELFAIGREYFKTLYYIREVSRLSRTLLVVSLPAILATATAILAINARILPEFELFGLPPLQSFVAAVFTLSLVPYVVLTAYMLRLSTVATRTGTGGPFSLE